MNFETKELPINYDELAPDGSEIRLLARMKNGSFCHWTLPAGKASRAVKHKTAAEIWYFLVGEGKVWPSPEEAAKIEDSWRKPKKGGAHERTQSFLLSLRVFHKRATSAVEDGSAVIRQAGVA